MLKKIAIVLVSIAVITVAIMLNINHDGDLYSKINGSIYIDDGDTKINWNRYPTTEVKLTDTLTVNKSGTYHLTGNLDNGSIIIAATSSDVVKLVLDNATIKNSSGPAIYCSEADDLVIELIGNNFIEDGTSYSNSYDETVDGAIYSKGDLVFQGDGSLNIISNYQDGIVGKDDVKFNGGEYTITAKDDGVRGKDSVYIRTATIAINSGADGVKSTNETTAGKGFVLVKEGDIKINAGDDGIHAIQRLKIENGNIDIEKSYEGLEAKVIAIDGGSIKINASDDGINAGGGTTATTNTNDPRRKVMQGADKDCILLVSGGEIYVNAAGDGIDSNGYIYFNGGSTIVDGPTNNGNGALDAGAGIEINGGTVIAVGASGMASTLGENSSVNNVSVYFASMLPAGTTITIKDADQNTVLEHTSAKTFNHLSAGTEALELAKSYTIYINDDVYQTFTILNTTTIVGGNRNNNQPSPPNGRRAY